MKDEAKANIVVSKLRSDKILDSRVRDLGNSCGAFFALAIERLGHDVLFQSCATCRHWQEEPEQPVGCRIYRILPPVKVIVLGCASFEDKVQPRNPTTTFDDEIPF